MSIASLTENFEPLIEVNGNQMGQGNLFSLTLARVMDIKDEKNLNRVRCLPITGNENELSEWCYVMTPMSGPERGMFAFPKVDDLVVLGYLENDPHSPIVLGGFWNTESKPPIPVKDGKVDDYCLRTPNKVDLTLHDEDKKQKITVTMPSGTVLEIDDENQTVTTKNKGGDTSLLMKMKDGEIELKAKNKLTITVGNASLTMEKNGNISIKGTGGNISIEGKGVSGKAQGTLSMQGLDAKVQATKDLALSATGNASLKGMLLKLN